MTIYQILGLQIDIPDLNDITQAIIGPIESTIGAIQNQIVTAVVSSLSFLNSIGQSVASTVTGTILPALGSLLQPVQTFLQTLYNGILAIPSQVYGYIQTGISQVSSALNSTTAAIQGFFQTYVTAPLVQLQSFLVSNFNAGIASVTGFINSSISSLTSFVQQTGSSLQSDFANAQNFVNARISELQQNVAAANQYLSTAVNQLSVNFQSVTTAFTQGFLTLGPALAKAFIAEIATLVPQVLNPLAGTLINILQPLTNTIKSELLARLPRSPDEAVDNAIALTEIGLGTLISGELAAIGLEALYPTKHLGITEAFHKGIEVLGIGEVTAGLYGLIVKSGFSVRLEQYFNFNLQPHKISAGLAATAVHYQVRTIADYQTALQYEGFDNDAISAAVATIYKPLAPRFLVKLLDDEVFNDDFYTQQLMQSGLDPKYVPQLLQSFQIMHLKSFASTAKTQIFTNYKDGLIDEATATNILKVFGTPQDQIGWILQLANIQYVTEQKVLIKDEIVAEVKKTKIDPGAAVAELINIGYDAKRAAVIIKLAAIQAAPTPSKADRQALADEVLNIPLAVS